MKKRLFVAAKVPFEIADSIASTFKVGKETNQALPQNFHITVLFLGDVEIKLIPEISARVRKLAQQTQPFTLNWDKVDYAPPDKKPWMIWAYLFPSKDYTEVVDKLIQEISQFSSSTLTRTKRIPHITLATFVVHKPAFTINLKPGVKINVNSITLFESRPGEKTSDYFVIEDFPFAT